MKLAVSSYSLSKWRNAEKKTLEDTIDLVSDLGVHGIEFSGLDDIPPSDPVKRAGQLRKYCDKKKLEIPSYCIGAELLVSKAKQKKVIQTLKEHVDIAAALGARSMRHDTTYGFNDANGYKGPKTFAAVLKHIVPAIREVADYAQTKGVITSLENHGFYMQASKRVEKLIQTVNHPNYGLTIDMGNFLCVNENPVEAVERCLPYVVMAHTKDFHVRPKKKVPPSGWIITPTSIAIRGAIVGHGEVDIPAELKLLKRAKYDGFLSLEFEGLEYPPTAVKLGIEYLREQFEKLKIKLG